MKRDSILLLSILQTIEDTPYDFSAKPIKVTVKDYSRDEIDYHVLLLHEAGLIQAVDTEAGRLQPTRMTWKRHEYLDQQEEGVIDSLAGMLSGFS